MQTPYFTMILKKYNLLTNSQKCYFGKILCARNNYSVSLYPKCKRTIRHLQEGTSLLVSYLYVTIAGRQPLP